MEERKITKIPHSITVDNRKSMAVSGVSDVDSFDDQSIVAYTDVGELTIRGKNLHISKLNLDTGEMAVEGQIDSTSYSDNQPDAGRGFFSKLFK